MAALKTTTFKTLYKHFVAQTSRARPAIADKQIDEITTSPTTEQYQSMQETIYNKAVEEKEETNPVFHQFCQEAEDSYTNTKCEKQKKLYEQAINDYLFLREAANRELHIMNLNRVGVDKNLKNIIEQTAKHVGLAMPKQFADQVKDPFEKK